MYKNRLQRTPDNLDLQSLIRRCDIEFDERARYVEFVCNIWNEGRFGPDLADPVTVNQNDRPEPASFLDLNDTGQSWLDGQNASAACCAFSILGRVRLQASEVACRRTTQMGFLTITPPGTHLTSGSSSNQGRGSPQIPKHQRCIVIQPAAPPQER